MCRVIQSRNNYGNKYRIDCLLRWILHNFKSSTTKKLLIYVTGQNLIHLDFIHRFITGDIWFETCTSEFQKFHFSSNNKVHVEDK